jgi:hypothetical protein
MSESLSFRNDEAIKEFSNLIKPLVTKAILYKKSLYKDNPYKLDDFFRFWIITILDNTCKYRIDLLSIYEWLGLTTEDIQCDEFMGKTLKEFFPIYIRKDGGNKIFNKIMLDINKLQFLIEKN